MNPAGFGSIARSVTWRRAAKALAVSPAAAFASDRCPSDRHPADPDQIMNEDAPADPASHPCFSSVGAALQAEVSLQDMHPPFDAGSEAEAPPPPAALPLRLALGRSSTHPGKDHSLDACIPSQPFVVWGGDAAIPGQQVRRACKTGAVPRKRGPPIRLGGSPPLLQGGPTPDHAPPPPPAPPAAPPPPPAHPTLPAHPAGLAVFGPVVALGGRLKQPPVLPGSGPRLSHNDPPKRLLDCLLDQRQEVLELLPQAPGGDRGGRRQ